MKSAVIKRSINLRGHLTSVSLEEDFCVTGSPLPPTTS